MLDRTSSLVANAVWPVLEKFVTPADVLSHVDEFNEIASWMQRSERARVVFDIASTFQDPHSSAISDEQLEDLTSAGQIGPGTSDLVMLVLPNAESPFGHRGSAKGCGSVQQESSWPAEPELRWADLCSKAHRVRT